MKDQTMKSKVFVELIGDCDPDWSGFLNLEDIQLGSIIDTTTFLEPGESVYQVIGNELDNDTYLVTVTEI